ncbi:cupin domain-containing protein [Halapricum salinum]|uniref:Cupin domain-containing protein n=1 Tax=Halapricum salinum TaxID=1457250 RepID=A0A4D6H7J5_9EURY|nr:cupin domain-containing protein [Halapricum salinum]QCC49749.1 cupin domain-containing protein [Halapricum salinum]
MSDRESLLELTGSAFEIRELLDYQSGAIVSQTLVDDESVTVTVFAFDEGERLSEHTAPHDAILQVVDGTAEITIDSEEYEVQAGESIVLPADEPHAVDAVSQFKMFLTMIR